MTSEESEFLKDCQQKDAPFPEIDLSYWAKLDHPVPATTVPFS